MLTHIFSVRIYLNTSHGLTLLIHILQDDPTFCSNEHGNRTWFQTDHGKLLQN